MNSFGKIYAVGIGPGADKYITLAARDAINKSTYIVGYIKYIEKIKHLVGGKQIIENGMKEEVLRCRAAIDMAKKGEIVSVISSGDAGIYGMAGLLMELLDADSSNDGVEVEVIPGISASSAAAAVLGAPLMNDFAVISLSDLLTPKSVIESRLAKLADSDLTCVLYNPRSMKRQDLLDKALALFSIAHGDDLLCAYVKHCTMDNQEKWVGRIGDFPVEDVNMSTVVILGNSQTVLKNGRLYSTRGYENKYCL